MGFITSGFIKSLVKKAATGTTTTSIKHLRTAKDGSSTVLQQNPENNNAFARLSRKKISDTGKNPYYWHLENNKYQGFYEAIERPDGSVTVKEIDQKSVRETGLPKYKD